MSPDVVAIAWGAAGALTTGLVALLFWFVKKYFEKTEKESDGFKRENKELADKIDRIHEDIENLYSKVTARIDDSNKGICERMQNLSDTIHQSGKETAKIEGRLDEHINMISSFISTIGHMGRQIDALFKYVDGNNRATDQKQQNG